VPNFQAHHQPFNYFANFAPGQPGRANLKDYADLTAAAQAGTLPSVAFYKPQGNLNQHPGYTDVARGDEHLAELIATLQSSPQWKNMAILVTYDENGGFWDHVSPPKGDRWGPGTRIPAIIISPYARRGYVDSTRYDTTSIMQFITRRFGLEPLASVITRSDAVRLATGKPIGDLTGAFALSTQHNN
jgi:acid phosphatase